MKTVYAEEIAKGDMRNLILGSSGMPEPAQRISLRGKQLKELSEQVNDDDYVVIKLWREHTYDPDTVSSYQRISIVRGAKEEEL